MLPASTTSTHRQRSASGSTDDHSTRENPRKFFHRYAHDLSMSLQSLVTTTSQFDDLHIPSFPMHTSPSHPASAPSTPTTSPSTGYSSLFPGSLSSATSESVPYTEPKYRSEFGVLAPGSHSSILGSASSRSSNHVSPWSQSTNELDTPMSPPPVPPKFPPRSSSHRPWTAPHTPSTLAAAGSLDNGRLDRHTRSQSRLTITIKNLLSLPTISSPSRFSFKSAATLPLDSEPSSNSSYAPRTFDKFPATPQKLRPTDLEISDTISPVIPSPSHTSSTLIDTPNRYTSKAAIYDAATGSGLPTSQEYFDVSTSNAPPPLVRGREPKTRNVLRRRPSGSAKLVKGRERDMSSPSHPRAGDLDHLRLPPKGGTSRQAGISFPLTPASAVVEAYKQQELYRDETSDLMSLTASHAGGYNRDHSKQPPTPRCTVFSSSSGRRVQAGGPDDGWNKLEADQSVSTTPQATSSHPPSMSDSVGRSVTRKVSVRWKRFKERTMVSEESPSRGRGHSKGRPSLQEMWGSDTLGMRSTGQSMDGIPNPGDSGRASPMVANHSGSSPDKGDGGEGRKLWRLMRRISTGGLRDRFQAEKVVPPVPAIPKELLEKVDQGDRGNRTSRRQPASSHGKVQARPFTSPRYTAVVRPSVATSSSLNSSDAASVRFFSATHSAHSSVSSYGGVMAPPRAPDATLDRHIITPLEQLRLADGHVQHHESSPSSVAASRSARRRSTSVPAGLRTVEDARSDDCVPLPLSGRPAGSVDPPSRGSSRLSIASGSAYATYRTDGIMSLSPPPRPSRNSKRGGDGSMTSSLKPTDGSGGVRQVDRMPSARSDMTARLDSPEPEQLDGGGRDHDRGVSPHTGAQLTFRELDGPRRPPLSEREKADIWDDLLARSDRAGGTLHINGAAELMSDSLRFSTISEI